ncbi:hypothetical protein B0T09DRAFT_85844 [Sordaria sp. MPI-SDFR-AT-0083]|nr:hypothetical protein B0T09DRAFT_85844 [Sordaria sp. MPI-SDFR-AT-0083]
MSILRYDIITYILCVSAFCCCDICRIYAGLYASSGTRSTPSYITRHIPVVRAPGGLDIQDGTQLLFIFTAFWVRALVAIQRHHVISVTGLFCSSYFSCIAIVYALLCLALLCFSQFDTQTRLF